MKFAARGLVVLAAAAAAASCGGGAGHAPGDYFANVAPYANTACNAVDGSLTGEREMRLFYGGDVDVIGLTRGLARYYQRHSLTFFTQASEQAAGTTYALDTNENALGSALTRAFPGVDLNDEAALMANPAQWNAIVTFVANFMLRPMIDFARAHGDVGQGATNFVVVPDLERPGGQKIGEPGTTIVGLAVSPPLLAEFAKTMTMEGDIWKGVNLPEGFTPMMFLGNNVIRSKTVGFPIIKDLIVAHEFGHASGLEHSDVSHNLMFPTVSPSNGCTDSLSEPQLATMRTNLGVGAAAASGALSAAERAAAREDRLAAPGASARQRPRFTPADLRAVLAGDGGAMRRLLGPLVHESGL
jgi:hypothetical protein